MPHVYRSSIKATTHKAPRKALRSSLKLHSRLPLSLTLLLVRLLILSLHILRLLILRLIRLILMLILIMCWVHYLRHTRLWCSLQNESSDCSKFLLEMVILDSSPLVGRQWEWCLFCFHTIIKSSKPMNGKLYVFIVYYYDYIYYSIANETFFLFRQINLAILLSLAAERLYILVEDTWR